MSAVLIAGPTASGKSRLAIQMARRLNGMIINADSMQVYRDLCVLTARPSDGDEAEAPHRLFGTVDGAIPYSIGQWLRDAGSTLAQVRDAGLIPILVGGTGLYFKALTQGLSDIPPVPDAIRTRIRDASAGLPASTLHDRLMAVDPITANKLRPTDPQRILRALEIFEATGAPLASFQSKRTPPILDSHDGLRVFLAPERAALVAQSDARFDRMLTEGAVHEVAALAARSLDPSLPVMRALGVPSLLAYLRGECDLPTASAQAKLETRQYIKRQFTFARHQLPDFVWLSPDTAFETMARA